LTQKKSALEELQHQIGILRLTPEQLAVIERYNKSVTHDPAFVEWITRKSTWYELVAAFVVSFFFTDWAFAPAKSMAVNRPLDRSVG
jgi:hypothetical protein